MKKSSTHEKRNAFIGNIREHKWTAAAYFILRIVVVITLVAQFLKGNFENVFLCVLTLVLFMLPNMVEKRFNVELPGALEVIILLFIFAAEILGEIQAFYIMIPYWDTILHTINGFMAAAIGFALVDILNKQERVSLSLSPFFMAVVAFCFSMTIGVLWEFFEFGADYFLGTDMQKDTVVNFINSVSLNPESKNIVTSFKNITDTIVVSGDINMPLQLGGYLDIGLYDTMEDLIVNFIGAFVFSTIGYFYVKSRGKNKILSNLIMKKKNGRRK